MNRDDALRPLTSDDLQNETTTRLLQLDWERKLVPASEFVILLYGTFQCPDELVFDHACAERVVAGTKLPVPIAHPASRALDPLPGDAIGWIGRLAVRHDGLYACDVHWGSVGRERARDLRYPSVALMRPDTTEGPDWSLRSLCLTNEPLPGSSRPIPFVEAP